MTQKKPGVALWIPAVAATIIIASAILGGLYLFFNELHLVNGLAIPVEVKVGDRTFTVPANGHVATGRMRVGAYEVETKDASGRVLETRMVYLRSPRRIVVYNVLGAGMLVHETIRYAAHASNEEPKVDIGCGKSVSDFAPVDFAWVSPPQSIQLDSRTSYVVRTALNLYDGGIDRCIGWALMDGLAPVANRLQAVHYELGVESAPWLESFRDLRGRAQLAKERLAKKPNDMESHRDFIGTFEVDGALDLIRPQYEVKLATPNASDLDRYLLARLMPVEERARFIVRSRQLYPESAWLAWTAFRLDYGQEAYARALADLDAIDLTKLEGSSLGPYVATARIQTMMRLGRARDVKQLADQMIETKAIHDFDSLMIYLAAATFGGDKIDDALAKIDPYFKTWGGFLYDVPIDFPKDYSPNYRAALKIARTTATDPIEGMNDLLRNPKVVDLVPYAVQSLLLFEAWRIDNREAAALLEPGLSLLNNLEPIRAFMFGAPMSGDMATESDFERALYWLARGRVEEMNGRPPDASYAEVKKLDIVHGAASLALAKWKPAKAPADTYAWSIDYDAQGAE